ncbi:50S ribosomal protein L29 [Patescibacteria group bacterium]|nr:50S ribosomal protein L29 [Patescibacteria group bacterium]
MKKTELDTIRSKAKEELLNDLTLAADKLWKLRKEVSQGKVKDVREIRKVKKQIAVTKTILNEAK